MKEIEKTTAKLKVRVEDFIVEEIGENWDAKISKEFKQPKFKLEGETKEFLWCEMEKRDIDHFQAIKELTRKLNTGVHTIGYAGTKDKKAQTSQRISIQHPNIEKIENFSHPNIILKNCKWNKRKIKMGYLEGNHFKITIRDIDKKEAIKISNQIKKTKWFPNYFGAQRFGSLRGNNVKIGELIIKRKFEEAVWTILADTSKTERPDHQMARKKLKREKDFKEASKYFPHYLKLEKELLFYLSRKKSDFIGAIKRAERKNMLMFVNSVQSKIFNEILEQALDEGLDFTKKGQQSCILPGYKTRFYDGRLGEIEREVMKNHNLNLEEFDIREIPYLRIKGSFRKAITEVKDLELEITDDDQFKESKKIMLSFTLPSGVYATTYLDKFFDFN